MTREEIKDRLTRIVEVVTQQKLPDDFNYDESVDDYVGEYDLNEFELQIEKAFSFSGIGREGIVPSSEDFMELILTGGSFNDAIDYINDNIVS